MTSDIATRTFRFTRRQRLWSLTSALPLLVWAVVSRPAGAGIGYALAIIPVLLLVSCCGWRLGVTLMPEGASAHGVQRRFIPWPDIQRVRQERILGTRTVVLDETGRTTRLRAPVTGPLQRDETFDEKYAEIVQWWLTHRGAGWRPLPPAWTTPTVRPPVLPTSVWPSQAATGLVALASAGAVAALTWWPRGDTGVGPVEVAGGRLPGTGWFLAGAVVVGLAGGLVLRWWTCRTSPPTAGDTPGQRVAAASGVVAAIGAGAAATALFGATSWIRIVPLIVPVMFLAAALTTAVACLATLR